MSAVPDLSYVATAADISPRVREALEELCLDTLSVVRGMLEHGTTEDRVLVAKALMPQMKSLLGTVDVALDTPQSKAIDYLAQIADGWRTATGSPRDDIGESDDEDW